MGQILAGKYDVIEELGQGSLCRALLCRNLEQEGLIVVVKVLHEDVARGPERVASLRKRITSLFELSHKNVLRVYDFLQDGDLVLYSVEYADDGDLEAAMTKTLPVDRIGSILLQSAQGLEAIHDYGIIHRNIKSGKLFLFSNGNVKVGESSISLSGEWSGVLKSGGVVGTIENIAPEYLLTGEVDSRGDIYCLGLIAYELIVGRSPFTGQSVIETMTKQLNEDPIPPRNLRPDCPDALSAIVLKAMSRDISQRFQTAGDLVDALHSLGI